MNRRDALTGSLSWLCGSVLLATAPGCSSKTKSSSPQNLEQLGRSIKRNDKDEITSMSFMLNRVSDEELASLADEKYKHLQVLSIQDCKNVTDQSLNVIGKLPELSKLSFLEVGITDKGLADLASLKNLSKLTLVRTNVKGQGLAHLADLPLKNLMITGPSMTADGLKSLVKLTRLQELRVNSGNLELQNLPKFKPISELKKLNLTGLKINDNSLSRIAGLSKLEEIEFDSDLITDKGLPHFATCPNLRRLNLNQSQITSKGLAALAPLKKLKELALNKKCNDAAFEQLSRLPSLERLDGIESAMSGTGIMSLKDHKHIKMVVFNSAFLTNEGKQVIQEFKKHRPQCEVFAYHNSGSVTRL
ncbi:MAG: hypothetical protein Tsb009_17480 [Planctomycetaceae bacterium]